MLTLRTWMSGTTLISPTVSPDTFIHPQFLQPHLDKLAGCASAQCVL